ncbi:hypothetical protein AABB24_032555 [Solanum stoloniferum]|uniref:CCHC-type domain-containing protein n=1 Tax=Solanum stoloniferum TaxID=62892 RepID=A0ABD2RKQ5_9SOLN
MDAFIRSLQTHEMNRNQEASKKEVKKDKSLSLKVALGNTSDEEEDMAYITRRFQKIVRKHGGFRKGGISGRAAIANDLCQKCGKPGHFIRDCPMTKAENTRPGGDKDMRRDLIPDKKGRRAAADYVVKKALAV